MDKLTFGGLLLHGLLHGGRPNGFGRDQVDQTIHDQIIWLNWMTFFRLKKSRPSLLDSACFNGGVAFVQRPVGPTSTNPIPNSNPNLNLSNECTEYLTCHAGEYLTCHPGE